MRACSVSSISPRALQMAFAASQSSAGRVSTKMVPSAVVGVSSMIQRRSFPASARRASCRVAPVRLSSAAIRSGVASTGAELNASSNVTFAAPSWLAGKSRNSIVIGTASRARSSPGVDGSGIMFLTCRFANEGTAAIV